VLFRAATPRRGLAKLSGPMVSRPESTATDTVGKLCAVTRGLVAGADSSTVIECAIRHFTGLAN
jgi:hypothetical protein